MSADPSNPTGPPPETPPPGPVVTSVVNPVDPLEPTAILPETAATSTETLGDVEGKPPKPIMGAVIALSKDSWSAWTGGMPKADWTGLDPSSQLETTSPNQLRPVYVSAAQKGYNHRRTGMTTLFNPADDLISFQNAVWDHLTDTGMDTIAYLPDPTDETMMSNVVKSHARYTVQSAQLLVKKQLVKYDKYDKTNDKAARTYLLASLTGTLSNKVAEKLEDSDPFPIVWLQFLKAIQSTSIERFEDLKASIKLRLPSQYPGENLEQLAAQFRKDALELTTAGQYDHNLTLSMMKIFLLAGGSGNEDFRFPLRATKQKLEQALLDIGFKEKGAANEHMSKLKLTYKDVCTQAEDTYRTLFDRKEWPPAKNVRDSKAPPSAYGNVAIGSTDSPITRAEVLNLIQTKPRFASDSSKNLATVISVESRDTGPRSARTTTASSRATIHVNTVKTRVKDSVLATIATHANLDGVPRPPLPELPLQRRRTTTPFIGARRASVGRRHTLQKPTPVAQHEESHQRIMARQPP